MDYLLGKLAHRSPFASLASYRGVWPRLHPSVFLADGARVVGDVEMGANSSVWFNAIVRGDVHEIRIGENTNIQDGAVIHCTFQKHACHIGDNVSIAHLVMVHGCTIENDCLIGMQAILMDGVTIGRGSIVGAGSVVTQGTIVPPGSLVLGAPAKVVRQVRPEERDGVLATTARYVDYARGYDFIDGRGHGR